MSEKKWKIAFQVQRQNAYRRGIGWELTYEQWREWWGDDIERRGTGECNLQMQRVADAGPYALGNIKKGTPKQNSATASIVRQNRACARAAEIREEMAKDLDDGDRLRETLDDNERELHAMFWPKSSSKCFDLMS